MKKLIWFALGAALAASSTMAFASVVTPGGSPTTPDSLTPTLVGSALDTVSGTITAGTFTATYSESVYNSTGNAGCTAVDCLTFEITFTNVSGQPNESLTIGPTTASDAGFLPFTDDVGDLAGGSGSKPLTVDETLAGVVAFNFNGADEITNGESTDTLIIETDATKYTSGNFSAIDSSTGTVAGLIPTATPEPNSLLLLGTGLIGAGGVLYSRRIRSQNT